MAEEKLWRVVPMDIHGWSIMDGSGNVVVGDIYHEEIARGISDTVNAARHFINAYDGSKSSMLGNGQARRSLDEFRAALALAEKGSE